MRSLKIVAYHKVLAKKLLYYYNFFLEYFIIIWKKKGHTLFYNFFTNCYCDKLSWILI